MRHTIRDRLSTSRLAAALAASLAALANPLAPAAEPVFSCAALLPSSSRTPAYARVSGEARCEGFFDSTVSQPFIELLSLLRQRPDALPRAAPAASAPPLQIKADGGSAAQLVIQPLAPSPFYRVDAALGAGQALRWNAAAMLGSTGLRLTELGFLARALPAPTATGDAAGTATRVLPVSLATTPPVPDDPAMVYAVLRVSVAVGKVRARSYPIGAGAASGATTGSGWRELPVGPLEAWDTLVLPIPLQSPSPETRVDVSALDANGQPLPLLQFTVVGR